MFFRDVVARLVRDGFMQIWVKLFADGFDRLQSIFGQKILELFEDETHSGIDRRLLPSTLCRFQPKLEIVDDGDELLEQALVRVVDRLLLVARAALFVILEVGLTAHRQVAKTIEIGLQTGDRIVAVSLFRSGRPTRGRGCRSCLLLLLVGLTYSNSFPVFRI